MSQAHWLMSLRARSCRHTFLCPVHPSPVPLLGASHLRLKATLPVPPSSVSAFGPILCDIQESVLSGNVDPQNPMIIGVTAPPALNPHAELLPRKP